MQLVRGQDHGDACRQHIAGLVVGASGMPLTLERSHDDARRQHKAGFLDGAFARVVFMMLKSDSNAAPLEGAGGDGRVRNGTVGRYARVRHTHVNESGGGGTNSTTVRERSVLAIAVCVPRRVPPPTATQERNGRNGTVETGRWNGTGGAER